MSLNAVKILGISITTNSKKEILKYIQKYLTFRRKKPLIIVTPNAEQLVASQKNIRFAKMLNQADVALPDGFPVARILGVRRIPGVEFMEDLIELASERGFPIALIGGKGGVAVEAFECLRGKYPTLSGWAVEPEEIEKKKIAKKILQTNTRIVFVGLGAPKQEYFMEVLSSYLLHLTSPIILMSVGGSFDIMAGRVPRAPVLIRSMGFEYIWRLYWQPWRFRRQLALLEFLWLVVRERLFGEARQF